jgi:acyl-ACP thioesterase
MKNYFDKHFELRYFEMNKFGVASTTTMLTLLEEAAAEHCHSIDYSLYDLEKQNIGWVLVSGVMQMERYPSYKEKITIRTWLSSYSTIRGVRENIIYDEKNNIIGKARGLWVFFDIERRRPTQILDDIKNRWSFCQEESLDINIVKKIKPLDYADLHQEFKVHLFDVDTNKHVNNIRYLQWLMESIPEEIIDNCFLHNIEGRFVGEAHYGDTILSFTEKGEKENSFIHTIRTKEDDKVCAIAKTFWRNK